MAEYLIKEMAIRNVAAGSILARSVFSHEGAIILESGSKLTDRLLERLVNMGIEKVAIRTDSAKKQDEAEKQHEVHSLDIKSKFPGKYVSLLDTINKQLECFKKIEESSLPVAYETLLEIMKKILNHVRCFNIVPVDELFILSDSMIKQTLEIPNIINKLSLFKKNSDYTSKHSVNVAIVSGVIGKWLNLEEADLKELLFTALVHDIGKAQIPWDILQKSGKLAERELTIMQYHVQMGYNLLKQIKKISSKTLLGVLQHHERIDGSGYPNGIVGAKIDMYAKIIAVADTFDAVTAECNYRRRRTAFSVLEILMLEKNIKFDENVCTVFFKNIRSSLLGHKVVLNNGSIAEIIELDETYWQPLVKLANGSILNLSVEKNISVLEIINI